MGTTSHGGSGLSPQAKGAAVAVLGLMGIAGVMRAWLSPPPPAFASAASPDAVVLEPTSPEAGAPAPEDASGAPPVASEPARGVSRLIDLNTASAAELDLLPGIGPALAARIIEDRAAHGPFRSLDDLDRVSGIGPKTVAKLAPFAKAE